MAAGGWQIDDEARLKTQREYGIFSTGPEERYDEIAAAVANLLDAPVSVVNFIERDRQWFKARHGIDASEPPIEQSICVHCLSHGDSLVIDDLTADRRTKDLPLVAGAPMMRFYAGAPIIVDGQGVGVLAVLDTQPRPDGLTNTQEQGLRAHADAVAALICGRSSAAPGTRDAMMAK